MPPPNERETTGWSQYEVYVTKKLDELSDDVKALRVEITTVRLEAAREGAKHGKVWGVITSAVIAALAWLTQR